MNILISDNIRSVVLEDGSLWSPDATRGYDGCKGYLDVFEEVVFLTRARRLDRPPNGWSPVCGPGVRGIPVPYFVGPWQLAPRYFAVRRAIREALRRSEAVSMRLPATLSQLVWGCVSGGRPYGVQVTGDPFAALAPGLHSDVSRGVFRSLYSKRLRRQIASASAVTYVTAEFLQQTYPPPDGVFATHYSDVLLPDVAFAPAPREARNRENPFRIVTVVSLANLIKRTDLFMESVGICLRAGLEVRAVIVGDGRYRAKMEALCRTMGLDDKVGFTGQLSTAAEVRNQLDQADLFVLPSETEGIPRAMLEAMARGLPCIGTAVGGIPELLSPENLVIAGDAQVLARKILEVAADPERLALMSRGNLEKVQAYRAVYVSRRRNAYCEALRHSTQQWLRTRRQ